MASIFKNAGVPVVIAALIAGIVGYVLRGSGFRTLAEASAARNEVGVRQRITSLHTLSHR